MNKVKRLKEIKNLLEEEGEVQNAELAERFKVSEMTIRRDIDQLSKDAAIIRTRGGAYLAPVSQQSEPSYTFRLQEGSAVKEKIAAKAAKIMQDHMNIFLDSGTTTECILKYVDKRKRYMVITNGINIAAELVNHSQISSVLIGGDFRTNTLSTAGPTAEEQVKRFRFDVAFLGANAIDENGNAYVGTTLEVGLKHSIIENSIKCYVLADSSKFNNYSLTSYINISNISGVITDSGISQKTLEQLESCNVEVIIAD